MHKTISNIAVLYPGNMADGITAWCAAAEAAGFDIKVRFSEPGTGLYGTAVVDTRDTDGELVRLSLKAYYQYSRDSGRDGISTVRETRPATDGYLPWRYFPVWEGPSSEPIPAKYFSDEPYLLTPDIAEDDHELHVLRTADGQVRAGIVYGMGAGFAAWSMGARTLTGGYRVEEYDLYDLSAPRVVWERAELAEEIAHWEEKARNH